MAATENAEYLQHAVQKLRNSKTPSHQYISVLLDAHMRAREREKQLLRRIEALEDGAGLHNAYRGVFDSKHGLYEAGSLATHGGSLWLALRHTGERPNGPDSGWKLIVKGTGRGAPK